MVSPSLAMLSFPPPISSYSITFFGQNQEDEDEDEEEDENKGEALEDLGEMEEEEEEKTLEEREEEQLLGIFRRMIVNYEERVFSYSFINL